MNSYALTLVLKPDLEENKRKELLESVKKRFTAEQGKIEKEDLWGVRDLAYPLKKNTKGYFAHFEIQANPKDAKGLDKSLDLEEDVLRYLLVRR